MYKTSTRYYVGNFTLLRDFIGPFNRLLKKRRVSASGLARILIMRELLAEGLIPPESQDAATYYTGPIRNRGHYRRTTTK